MSVYLPKYFVEAEFNTLQNISRSGSIILTKGILSSSFKRLWDIGYTGRDITVAVVDTGIDGNHPDLVGKVVESINLTGEEITESHGTHVAGTIAAKGWIRGGALDAKLLDIKVMGKMGGTISNVIKAISLATSKGASIINLSLGSKDVSQIEIQHLTNVIENAWNRGTICIAAAGNDGTSICTTDPLEYPASISKTESIAACIVGEDMNNISPAPFSNENNAVDLAACGYNVLSCVLHGGYGIYSGTSMATPHVSAMAAVLSQYIHINQPELKDAAFSSALISLLHSSVFKLQGCDKISTIKIKNKPLLSIRDISYGLGYLRYNPNDSLVIPMGERYYYENTFLGYTM